MEGALPNATRLALGASEEPAPAFATFGTSATPSCSAFRRVSSKNTSWPLNLRLQDPQHIARFIRSSAGPGPGPLSPMPMSILYPLSYPRRWFSSAHTCRQDDSVHELTLRTLRRYTARQVVEKWMIYGIAHMRTVNAYSDTATTLLVPLSADVCSVACCAARGSRGPATEFPPASH
jgi:hypothetical protein